MLYLGQFVILLILLVETVRTDDSVLDLKFLEEVYYNLQFLHNYADACETFDIGTRRFQCGEGGTAVFLDDESRGSGLLCIQVDDRTLECNTNVSEPHFAIVKCVGQTDQSRKLVYGGYTGGSATCAGAVSRGVLLQMICRESASYDPPFARLAQSIATDCLIGNASSSVENACQDQLVCTEERQEACTYTDLDSLGVTIANLTEIPENCSWDTDVTESLVFRTPVSSLYSIETEFPTTASCPDIDLGRITFTCGPGGQIASLFDESVCADGGNDCAFSYSDGLFSSLSPALVACSGSFSRSLTLQVEWTLGTTACKDDTDSTDSFSIKQRQRCVSGQPFNVSAIATTCFPLIGTDTGSVEGDAGVCALQAQSSNDSLAMLTSTLPEQHLDRTCFVPANMAEEILQSFVQSGCRPVLLSWTTGLLAVLVYIISCYS